jgi:hypothetical protein
VLFGGSEQPRRGERFVVRRGNRADHAPTARVAAGADQPLVVENGGVHGGRQRLTRTRRDEEPRASLPHRLQRRQEPCGARGVDQSVDVDRRRQRNDRVGHGRGRWVASNPGVHAFAGDRCERNYENDNRGGRGERGNPTDGNRERDEPTDHRRDDARHFAVRARKERQVGGRERHRG